MTSHSDPEEIVDRILETVGHEIVLAMPIAIGKANHIVNCLYRRAKRDAEIRLTILTGLSLNKPHPTSYLETRLMAPIVERLFGDYPDLEYELDREADELPVNVRVSEFFFRPGSLLDNADAQQHYISSNYTHVARDLLDQGVNVVAQQVAPSTDHKTLSLSCNPDVTLDLRDLLEREGARKTFFAAEINRLLPYMYGDAVVEADWFDGVLDNPSLDYRPFGAPKTPVPDTDYLIGWHASTLIRDGGEIQVGIGSLGDALVHALITRHTDNAAYREVLNDLDHSTRFGVISDRVGDLSPFRQGLHGGTEMLVDGFQHLIEAGIVRRKVYDDVALQRLLNDGEIGDAVSAEVLSLLARDGAIGSRLSAEDVRYLKRFGILRPDVELSHGLLSAPDGSSVPADLDDPEAVGLLTDRFLGERLDNGAIVNAGFFMGSPGFYEWLRDLPDAERRLIHMNRISRINQLYGHEELDRLQRRAARFMNTCLVVTLSGAAASDALEDGRVLSGVGGQYNFVAMAHELPDARSILQLRSTRTSAGRTGSNIVLRYGHTTIPRHLRDIVVTEYGIADLRGKMDSEVASSLIEIADSRFQPGLVRAARSAGKLRRDYVIPPGCTSNTPAKTRAVLARRRELFPAFPFGTDLTPVEQHLGRALRGVQRATAPTLGKLQLGRRLWKQPTPSDEELELLRRMGLDAPRGFRERIHARILLAALRHYV